MLNLKNRFTIVFNLNFKMDIIMHLCNMYVPITFTPVIYYLSDFNTSL